MAKISLDLDIHEVNIIIKALSERPFREVYELIGKIHAQSNVQLSSPEFHEPSSLKHQGD